MTPSYPHKPIANVASLCKLLDLSEIELNQLLIKSWSQYRIHERRLKEDGSERLIYSIQPELKRIHKNITYRILKQVTYPSYIHGSVQGKDYISNISQHTGKTIVISEDITNFFPSLKSKVIHEIWVGFFNFPNEIAEILTKLVTYKGALVQGCPASSYLANLVLWGREEAIYQEFKDLGITYTRYVDDVTISSADHLRRSDISKSISKIYSMFRTIGTKPNRGKHKVMSNSVNQSVHNINVNSGKPTMPRKRRDIIRATVHKCEISFEAGNSHSPEYEKQYNVATGKVNNLKRMHVDVADKLLARLKQIKPYT